MRIRTEVTDELIFEWTVAYLSGHGLKKIAKNYGASPTTVRKYLLQEGIEMRPKGVPEEKQMKNTGLCAKGHDLSLHGIQRETHIRCLECDRIRHRERYQNDPEYAERHRARIRRHREKKKRERDLPST